MQEGQARSRRDHHDGTNLGPSRRLVYRLLASNTDVQQVEVLSIGPRRHLIAYAVAAARLRADRPGEENERPRSRRRSQSARQCSAGARAGLWQTCLDRGGGMQRPWDEVFALAWASYLDATTPVGAVLRDASGGVVATGQGRRSTSEPVQWQLAGSRLAHAEVNALAGVDPYTDVRDHTLLTTVEPCSLCVGASIQARVGTVVHAGRDPYAGATTMVLDNHQTRLHRPVFAAEDDPNWRDAGAILLLLFYLDVLPNPRVVAAFRESAPELVERVGSRRVRGAVSEAAASAAGWDEVRHALC